MQPTNFDKLCFHFHLQVTLKQHGFEPCGSTYMQIFFNKYVVQYYTISGWLNPCMGKHGYGGLTVKLYTDFQLHRVSAPNPCLFKGQL